MCEIGSSIGNRKGHFMIASGLLPGALGGTRTPSLLIRRLCHAHPPPADSRGDLLKYCSQVRSRRQCCALPGGQKAARQSRPLDRCDAARPRQVLVHGLPAFWMQTTGPALIAVRLCSPVRMWTLAQGSGCARGLLYLAAVRDDWREYQPCRVRGPNTPSSPRGLGRRRSWSPWPGLLAHRIWLLGAVVQRVSPAGGDA
jgi:hypothetical protein